MTTDSTTTRSTCSPEAGVTSLANAREEALEPALTQPGALSGRHIVITRPQHQAGTLTQLIQAAGGLPVSFPLLTIRAIEASQRPTLQAALRDLIAGCYQLAIFVSPNAIHYGFNELHALGARWPDPLPIAVVGKGSEQALSEQNIARAQIIAPSERFDSEGLLALPPLQQMQGKRVLILRGDGGRELTAQTLRARGARVDCIPCYHRDAPTQNAAELMHLWQTEQLDGLTLTSSEGLRHLYELLDERGRDYLMHTPVFAPHARIIEQAQALGLQQTRLTAAGDAGLLQGLLGYFAAQRSSSARTRA